MEQQDAKNLITLEKFLDSLQDIIGGFKSYVDSTNRRIDNLDKTINELSKRVNENTSIVRETKKETINKLDNINRELGSQEKELSKSLESLTIQISQLKE